jgi:hypothetical protein
MRTEGGSRCADLPYAQLQRAKFNALGALACGSKLGIGRDQGTPFAFGKREIEAVVDRVPQPDRQCDRGIGQLFEGNNAPIVGHGDLKLRARLARIRPKVPSAGEPRSR